MSSGSVAGRERLEVGRASVLEQVARGFVHAVRQRALGPLDDVDPLEERQFAAHLQDPLEEAGVLHDGDARLGVTGEVQDLLRRRRVVDADRRGPEELRGGVEPVEVRSVAHHQQHPFTCDDAGSGSARLGLGDVLGIVLHRPGVPPAVVAHRVQCGRRGVTDRTSSRKSAWHVYDPRAAASTSAMEDSGVKELMCHCHMFWTVGGNL
jgi:hypothetical protein